MQAKGYIFNVSFYVDPDQYSRWRDWLDKVLFPFVEKILPGNRPQVFEVLSEGNQGIMVFSVQFQCSDKVQLERIQEETLPVFDLFKREFGEQVTHFNSVLSRIQ
ncbi:DUF4286 family protein [Thermophagus sp. OGC60D27]|uniref:DUF4286 family protein n=1 Tax=Thermophagus sp. OGC60D27 TaxID=3458415 RepID=UPI004037C96E